MNIASDPGIMVKVIDGQTNGYHFLSIKYGYLDFCAPVPPELQKDGLQIHIFGTIKMSCPTPGISVPEVERYSFELTGYSIPTDSLFQQNPLAIRLFPSQTTESTGFGYSITGPGISIRQEIIPAIGGLHTFSTPTKAFKASVLVGHRVVSGKGASLSSYDLNYLDLLD